MPSRPTTGATSVRSTASSKQVSAVVKAFGYDNARPPSRTSTTVAPGCLGAADSRHRARAGHHQARQQEYAGLLPLEAGNDGKFLRESGLSSSCVGSRWAWLGATSTATAGGSWATSSSSACAASQGSGHRLQQPAAQVPSQLKNSGLTGSRWRDLLRLHVAYGRGAFAVGAAQLRIALTSWMFVSALTACFHRLV